MTEKSDHLSEAQIEQRREAGKKGGMAKKGKPLSEAEIQQRRSAALMSTGPVTDEGKAASSRNAWKHGDYSLITRASEWGAIGYIAKEAGKPCLTTCDKYPCSLVDDGITKEGGDCLDKTVFVRAFDAIMNALSTGNGQFGHGLVAMTFASAVDLLHQVREEIDTRGVIIEKEVFSKEGVRVGTQPIINPAFSHYTKLFEKMGLNFSELRLTPKSATDGDGDSDDLGELMQSIGEKFGRGIATGAGVRAPQTFNHDDD